jgi:tRNA(Arg) A34 adenosine deaminase TadA
MTKDLHRQFLERAIRLAEESVDTGGGPFGAVIVKDGKIIASASNRVTVIQDPTAHAEIQTIREAASKLGSWDLSGCILYTSCEPCPMCMGAVYWAHIRQVYYACTHRDARDAGFDDSMIYDELRMPPSERSVSMLQQLRPEGLKAFRKWTDKMDRKPY